MKRILFPSPFLAALAAACLLLPSTGSAQQSVLPMPILLPMPIGPAPIVKFPRLSGSLTDLTIKPTASGNSYRVKAQVTIRNKGQEPAKKVTGAVYLSDDSTLSSTAEPIVTLDLSTFFDGDGKVKKLSKVVIPLNQKVPKVLAPALSGKYIIIVLSGSNVPADLSTPIVFGPLPKVP